MSRNKGLGGLLRNINDVSRTVNNLTHTSNNVRRTSQNVARTNNRRGNNDRNDLGQQAVDSPSSWNCECGVSSTTKFCGGCGKLSPAELACTECGWKRPLENSNMKFCGECGTMFEE